MNKKNVSSYILFGVVTVVIWLIAMIIGLFFWSFLAAARFGMAFAAAYAIITFSVMYLKGHRIDAIASGVFCLLLCAISAGLADFVEKANWADKTIVITSAGDVTIGYTDTATVEEAQQVNVSEVSEMDIEVVQDMDVSTIENLNVTEIENISATQIQNQAVSEIATQQVSEIKKMEVTKIDRMDVTEVEEMNITEVDKMDITKVDRMDITEVDEMNISKVDEMNVSEINQQNVSVIHEQNVTQIDNQNVTQINNQNVGTTTPAYTTQPTVETAHTHSWQLTSSKQPTCTDAGYEKYSCSCGQTSNKNLSALGHSWSSYSTTEATCTNAGSKVRTCSRCGKEDRQTIPAKGHSWSSWSTTEATCTNTGSKVRTCSQCGKEERETIPAKGHSYDNGVVTTQATCNQQGVKTYTCRNCGNTKTESIPMTNHNFGAWQHDDYQHWHECTTCGTRQDTASHSWDAGTITSQATEYSTGIKTYRCSVCSHTKTETIPMLKPAVVMVDATFGSPNYTYGSTVTVTLRFKNTTSVPSSVVHTSLGNLNVVMANQVGSDYCIVYNVENISEANVGSQVFLSLDSGYSFSNDPVCTITE